MKTHSIDVIESMGIYRDGGSLSIDFRSDSKTQQRLFFKILCSDKQEFDAPQIQVTMPTVYVSPITGVSTPDRKVVSNGITWAEARTLLEELRPFAKNFNQTTAGSMKEWWS